MVKPQPDIDDILEAYAIAHSHKARFREDFTQTAKQALYQSIAAEAEMGLKNEYSSMHELVVPLSKLKAIMEIKE